MQKRTTLSKLHATFAIASIFALCSAQATKAEELLVSAAVSLKDVLSSIKSDFESSHPGTKIVFNFGASGQLARQIEQGATTDVFVSASMDQMRALEKQKLISANGIKSIAGNALVVVVPSRGKCISDLKELPSLQRITIGDPSIVPAGTYAREALTAAGVYNTLTASHKVVFAESVRQCLTYVESGNVDAGIIYSTDSRAAKNVKTCLRIPRSMTGPIVYCAATTEGSHHKSATRAFMAALLGPAAQRAFKSQGFEAPP